MLDNTEEALPRLVDLAMETCGAVSGGISVLEPEPAPGVFRWQHVRGAFASLEGGTIPRDISPCSKVLDDAAPLLLERPERLYGWMGQAGAPVPECLIVPLFVDGGQPLGTLWLVSAAVGQFCQADAELLQQLAGFAGIAFRLRRNQRDLQEALEREKLFSREMAHRIQNTLAIVDTIVRMTARTANSPKEMAEAVSGRLHALRTAQERARAAPGDSALPLRMSDLIEGALQPFRSAPSQIAMAGDDIELDRDTAAALALVLHEMATNAMKYGALGHDTGRVEVRWQVVQDTLRLAWSESGGPPVEGPPSASGFGTTVCARMMGQIRGTIRHQWRREGVLTEVAAPLSQSVGATE